MAKKAFKENEMKQDLTKEELRREFRRNIIIGSVLRSVHKKQGTMPYLIQMVEPYLKKADRQLFGLPF